MNRSGYLKRQLLSEMLKLVQEDRLSEEIDLLPVKMFPRSSASYRCCLYKDRAMLRFRLLAMMGFIQEEEVETRTLASYAREAKERKTVPEKGLTLMQELCSGCDGGHFTVTELCRGCVARSCSRSCPRHAVEFSGGRARIDRDRCVGCGKCREACAFSAVVYHPVPCEESCPVQAVVRDSEGNRTIDEERCIHCGNCVTHCPFGAPLDVSHVVDVSHAIQRGRKVKALLAPSGLGQFPEDPARLRGALLKAGFAGVYDVAQGAARVAEEEALESLPEGPLFTSCCPSWVLAAEKHLSGLSCRLSHTPSPMAVTAEAVREPGDMIVFIGPCFAKKEEARRLENVDAVLTFEELGSLLMSRNIQLEECPSVGYFPIEGWSPSNEANNLFARAGGVGNNLMEHLQDEKVVNVDGLSRKNLKALKNWDKFYKDADFVEVMSCSGGCIAGPGVLCPSGQALKRLNDGKKILNK